MKKYLGPLVAIALFTGSTQAFSANEGTFLQGEELLVHGNADHYRVLEGLFAQGTAPTIEEVRGWSTGRCYAADAPNTPMASLLVGFIDSSAVDHGPLFPENFKATVLSAPAHSAHYFDVVGPERETQIRSAYRSIQSRLDSVYTEGNSLVSTYDNGKYGFDVRRTTDYLIVKYHQGQAREYCYYFKKLR